MKRLSLLYLAVALAAPLNAQYYRFFSTDKVLYAINSAGQVAAGEAVNGIGTRCDSGQAFLWSRTRGFEPLGSLGGGISAALAINESGQVAGCSALANGAIHAFLWTPTEGMKDLGSPLGGDSYSLAINNNGEVAGSTTSPGGATSHVFFWSANTGAVDVEPLPGDKGTSFAAFNNNGEIAGVSGPSSTPFRWTLNSGIVALPSFGGSTTLKMINDSGQIAGWSFDTDGTQHAALWSANGDIQDLGMLPGDVLSFARAINAAGHIVGSSGNLLHQDNNRVFFWSPETEMLDLGFHAGPHTYVAAINNRDQVLGHNSGNGGGVFLWSPALGLHKIATGVQQPFALNAAGQYLARHGRYYTLATPIMRVSLSSSQNPSKLGQSVTFTANVKAFVGLPPDGDVVTFHDGGRVLGQAQLTNGTASFTTYTLKVGTHRMFAKYEGDSNYYPSRSTDLQQAVNPESAWPFGIPKSAFQNSLIR